METSHRRVLCSVRSARVACVLLSPQESCRRQHVPPALLVASISATSLGTLSVLSTERASVSQNRAPMLRNVPIPADQKRMDDVVESKVDDAEAEVEQTVSLNEGDQALLDMMKSNHALYAEATFAMWLRVPLMESKQKFALAAFVVLVPLGWLTLSSIVPAWALAVVTAVGALAVGAFAERDVLSLGPDGLKVHRPAESKVGPGIPAEITYGGGKVVVNGDTYAASKASLGTLAELRAAD